MSFLKKLGGVRLVLAALAMLVASSQVAMAQTIFLNCNPGGTFTVDLTNNTVDNRPATINAAAIDWQKDVGGDVAATIYSHIDRTAGTYSMSITYHTRRGDQTGHAGPYPCSKSSAPDQKF